MAIIGPGDLRISPELAARRGLAYELFMAMEGMGTDPLESAWNAGCDTTDITRQEAAALRREFNRLGRSIISRLKR